MLWKLRANWLPVIKSAVAEKQLEMDIDEDEEAQSKLAAAEVAAEAAEGEVSRLEPDADTRTVEKARKTAEAKRENVIAMAAALDAELAESREARNNMDEKTEELKESLAELYGPGAQTALKTTAPSSDLECTSDPMHACTLDACFAELMKTELSITMFIQVRFSMTLVNAPEPS